MITGITLKDRYKTYKKIGHFDTESKVWFVERNKEKHYMKVLRGWGLDNWMYEKLRDEYKMERVIITETNSKKVYECRVETIEVQKMYKTFHPHRLQIFIPKIYWKIIDDGKKY